MQEAKTKSYDVPHILRARNILEKDPATQITITALALEVGLNSVKLCRGFKQIFHQTIHQYRLDLRLKSALQLLEDTDLTIAEIAYKSGFDSRDGFAKCFRKKYRKSPREWRKEPNPPTTQWNGYTPIAMPIVLALN